MTIELQQYPDTMRTLVCLASPTAEVKTLINNCSRDLPKAAIAGLWLYFDCFDESHKISQDDPSAEGSYWHAIAHRREPDYSNSGYWYRRVGKHPTFPDLLEAVRALAFENPPLKLGSQWDPLAFVDLCERAASSPSLAPYALEVQRLEWRILFDYCK